MSERPEEWDRSRDEIISGEYVLGVLSAEDRRKVEARMAVDRRFAQQVRRWQANLSGFNEDYEDIRPPADLYNRIERRIFGTGEIRAPGLLEGIWGSVMVWRGLTVASLAIAAGVIYFEGTTFLPGTREKPLVAELSGQNSPINLVATFDFDSGRLSVVPAAFKQNEPQSLEVWIIDEGKPPQSLGILPDNGNGEIIVTNEMRKTFTEGKTIAITIEPYGGAPGGAPTGPIVAQGKTRFL
ncbi:anti-sigma factor [Rhizobium sp. TH2]|uniref:anti-sigma factor n=1 Tax=Rhizobium sp. TH2 TaxID=2775403 RepID=UPI002157B29B|nr:anti-sigma factor [Rhizobium sp. TH2]UVC09105.1 anti-sigma factor [Rhizobium sp. TH2]